MSRLFLAALGALLALPAIAGPFVPGGNSSALARSFALPALGDPVVPAAGQGDLWVTLGVTNEYVKEGVCSVECIILDGETALLRVSHRRGLGDGWDLSIDVPLLDQDGGFLDGWIQDWHGWFGLPNGGREQAADDRYQYYYQRGAAVLLDETRGDTGLGDVSVGLGRTLGSSAALRGMIKLPTADAGPLAGGNTGGALWLELALPVPAGWAGYFSAGGSYQELGDILPAQQKREVYFGGIGLLAPLTQTTRLVAQVQGHTRLYGDSEVSPLRRRGVPLTVGLQFATGGGGTIDIGFQEDLSVNGSPDFVAYVAVSSR
jgi:hypothetical protein